MSVKFVVNVVKEEKEGEITELVFSMHENEGDIQIWVDPKVGDEMFKVLTITKEGKLIHEDEIPDNIGLQTDSDGELEYDYRSTIH